MVADFEGNGNTDDLHVYIRLKVNGGEQDLSSPSLHLGTGGSCLYAEVGKCIDVNVETCQ